MIKKITLTAVYERVVKNDPDGSRKAHFKAFLAEVKESETLVEMLAEEFFERAHSTWKLRQVGDSVVMGGTPATERRVERSAEKRAESAERVTAAKDELKARLRQVLLLDLVMPNGKKLRDATGAECAKAGGFYTEIARHMKPTQVVDKQYNEKDLREMQTRFYDGKRRGTGEQRAHA